MVRRAGHLQWTHLRLQKGKSEKEVGPGPIPGPAAGSEVDFDLSEALTALASEIKGELHYALDSEELLLRVVELPTVEPEEIPDMVELQIDKYSPFPADHLYLSHEVLSQTATSSRVVIAAAPKPVIDPLVEAFSAAGLNPARFDVDLLAWWELISQSNRMPTRGRQLIVILDHTGTALIVCDDQVPNTFSTFGMPESESDEEFLEHVGEELSYVLTSIESEWGEAETTGLHVWHWGSVPNGLDRLQRATGLNVSTCELQSLPKLSEAVAERGQRDDVVDLVPKAWKEQAAEQHFKQHMIRTLVTILAVWLVLAVAFFAVVKLRDAKHAKLLKQYEANKLAIVEVQELRVKVGSLKRFTDRTYSSLECLREVVVWMPNGAELKNFSYHKNDRVEITGKAASEDLVLTYTGKLEAESTLFSEVKISSVRPSGGAYEFKVIAKLPSF